MSCKVSIIICIYNAEAGLNECLESLTNQTLKEIEIILIDDGSTDKSSEIYQRFAENFENLKICKLDHKGVYFARNKGLSLVSGEYVGFVDGDDTVDLQMFEKMYEKAVHSDADIVNCNINAIDSVTGEVRLFGHGKCSDFDKSVEENPSLIYKSSVYLCNKIYRRTMLDRVKLKFVEEDGPFFDIIFTYQLLPFANKISRVNEPLYNHFMLKKNSITKKAEKSNKIELLMNRYALLNEDLQKLGLLNKYEKEYLVVNLRSFYKRVEDSIFLLPWRKKYSIIRAYSRMLNQYFPEWQDVVFNEEEISYIFDNNRVFKDVLYKSLPLYIMIAWYSIFRS